MAKNKKIIFVCVLFIISSPLNVYSYSARHHLINMSKSLMETAFSPFYGAFIQGPKNIKEAYYYEVWGREKREKRGLLRYKLFAIWRAFGEETKGIVDGIVNSVKAGGKFLKELVSIFFSD